jgi:charged multivesicular body protein 3
MQELQKEMIKSGIIEEMLEDTLAFSEPDDLENLAQEEVDKVLYELTDGLFGDTQVPSKLPILKSVEKEQEDMSKRLKALNS